MAQFEVLICLHRDCGYEVEITPGELPSWCPSCQQPGKWRFALKDEFTQSDQRFLRSIKILALTE
jgi:hypothetical protein